MGKKLMALGFFALVATLAFFLPPRVFSYLDDRMLETRRREDYTVIALNTAVLTPEKKLSIIGKGDGFQLTHLESAGDADTSAVLGELQTLADRVIFPFPLSDSLEISSAGPPYLLVDGDLTTRIQFYDLYVEGIPGQLVYSAEDNKIYGFILWANGENDFMLAANASKGFTEEQEAVKAFADYLGLAPEPVAAFPGYYPLTGGGGLMVFMDPYSLGILPMSEERAMEWYGQYSPESAPTPLPQMKPEESFASESG